MTPGAEGSAGLRVDAVAGAVAIALAAAFAWEAAKLPLGTVRHPGPAFFPLALAGLLAIGGAMMVASARTSPPLRRHAWPELGIAAKILAVCAFAGLALVPLGYRLTVAAMLVALLRGVERRPWGTTLAVALGLSLASYWVFATKLLVQLPTGPWGL